MNFIFINTFLHQSIYYPIVDYTYEDLHHLIDSCLNVNFHLTNLISRVMYFRINYSSLHFLILTMISKYAFMYFKIKDLLVASHHISKDLMHRYD